jgi:hypothetical protein
MGPVAPRNAVVVACCLMITALAACGSSEPQHPLSSEATTTAAARGPVTCNGYTKGKSGVINVFCGGSAKASGTIGGDAFSLSGGSCVQGATFISVNAGVLVGPDFLGSPPDYFGIVLKPIAGPFTNAAATIDSVGTPHAVIVAGSLDGDMRGGEFTGSDGSLPVSGSFSC